MQGIGRATEHAAVLCARGFRRGEESHHAAARVGEEVSAVWLSNGYSHASPGRLARERQADLSTLEEGRPESAEENAEKATFGPRREQLRAPSG